MIDAKLKPIVGEHIGNNKIIKVLSYIDLNRHEVILTYQIYTLRMYNDMFYYVYNFRFNCVGERVDDYSLIVHHERRI